MHRGDEMNTDNELDQSPDAFCKVIEPDFHGALFSKET